MTTPEQARELMQRLRLGVSIAKERDLYSGYIPVALASTDCIESLLAEVERLRGLLEEAMSYTSCPSWSPSLTQEIKVALERK